MMAKRKGIFPIIFERFKTLLGYSGRSHHQRSVSKERIGAKRRPKNYHIIKKSRRKMARASRRNNR
jgi:hypothetical protein